MSERKDSSGLYVDTSCLLKLFFLEPESERVASIVEAERRVVVSELAILESAVQIHGRRVAGTLGAADAKRLESALERMITAEPFMLVPVAPESLETARKQLRRARRRASCRTLDRLHLGIMAFEGIRRLLTNDDRQAAVARALGLRVTLPRRSRTAARRPG